jgi:hypothetical protein
LEGCFSFLAFFFGTFLFPLPAIEDAPKPLAAAAANAVDGFAEFGNET